MAFGPGGAGARRQPRSDPSRRGGCVERTVVRRKDGSKDLIEMYSNKVEDSLNQKNGDLRKNMLKRKGVISC